MGGGGGGAVVYSANNDLMFRRSISGLIRGRCSIPLGVSGDEGEEGEWRREEHKEE